jgi:hypothetical protein
MSRFKDPPRIYCELSVWLIGPVFEGFPDDGLVFLEVALLWGKS